MTLETIDIKVLDERTTIPTRSHSTDAGLDLYALEDTEIYDGETVIVPTGIAVDIPEGYEAQVRPRSGVTSRGTLTVHLGTIDCGYTGDIGVITTCRIPPTGRSMANSVRNKYRTVKAGDKIAQLVISPIETPKVNIVSEFESESERGENGFGSTDVEVPDSPRIRAKEAEQFFSGMHGGW